MTLVLVESPTKAKTLSKFLPSTYKIEATAGHIRDLPKTKMGVDIEHDFAPQYIVPKDKKGRVEELKKLISKEKDLILATDPDREGEAIAWHTLALFGKKVDEVKRIVFHEITQGAVEKALEHPRHVDEQLVNAQQARRVLDRLVGYKLSPLLWYKIKRGLSAGRVQSVALRLIVEREKEIEAFKPEEYWEILTLLQAKKGEFEAKLTSKENKKITVKNETEALGIVKDLQNATYRVSELDRKDVRRNSHAPFTTSTLQQTAANRLGFSAKKTMKMAQDLYEEGLITYHRTDSVNLSEGAVLEARKYIESTFGKEYLPQKAVFYKTKSKLVQEAHEAIRPTNIKLKKIELTKDHQRLYDLIWKRFLACQMREAIYDQLGVDITAGIYLLHAAGSIVKFDGFLKVYGVEKEEEEKRSLPELEANELLKLLNLNSIQHFTEPPARYTEATLIKHLEEKGIGRPSTYAPIISTLLDRHYVERLVRALKATPLGVAVSDFLVANFGNVVNVDFTAKMEDDLDEIAHGKVQWVPVVKDFYQPFDKHLQSVFKEAHKVKVQAEMTDELCPEGHHLVVRYGRFGKFLACEKFPEHKFTKTYEETIEATCPEDQGQVVIKRTKRGRAFFGCSNYPKCNWMSWKNPLTEKAKEASSSNEQ